MSTATRVSASSIGTCTSDVACDALHVAECLLERLTKRNADVLGGVVVVDVQVALGLGGDVDARMARQQVQHMVEEADPGRDLRRAFAVEVDGDVDIGFLGRALDLARPHKSPFGACRGRGLRAARSCDTQL